MTNKREDKNSMLASPLSLSDEIKNGYLVSPDEFVYNYMSEAIDFS